MASNQSGHQIERGDSPFRGEAQQAFLRPRIFLRVVVLKPIGEDDQRRGKVALLAELEKAPQALQRVVPGPAILGPLGLIDQGLVVHPFDFRRLPLNIASEAQPGVEPGSEMKQRDAIGPSVESAFESMFQLKAFARTAKAGQLYLFGQIVENESHQDQVGVVPNSFPFEIEKLLPGRITPYARVDRFHRAAQTCFEQRPGQIGVSLERVCDAIPEGDRIAQVKHPQYAFGPGVVQFGTSKSLAIHSDQDSSPVVFRPRAQFPASVSSRSKMEVLTFNSAKGRSVNSSSVRGTSKETKANARFTAMG